MVRDSEDGGDCLLGGGAGRRRDPCRRAGYGAGKCDGRHIWSIVVMARGPKDSADIDMERFVEMKPVGAVPLTVERTTLAGMNSGSWYKVYMRRSIQTHSLRL